MSVQQTGEHVGRVLGARYRILELIGSGASARVYLAQDVQLKRRVAVKLLHDGLSDDPTFRRRFEVEAQSAAALNHPNIVAVFDWGDSNGVPYLVTEHLGGGSLRQLLDRVGRLSGSQALVIGLEAARALDHAHRRGFVHRDVKPANLMFGEEGRLRIADFGLARALAEASITEPGTMMGTARYAAPEQGDSTQVDGRADVYALALVLTEAVTGEVPLTAETLIATMVRRHETDLAPGTQLGALAAPLAHAGRADVEERSDAGELVLSLMATASKLSRPEPLPLVMAKPSSEPIPAMESTRIAPVAETAARAAERAAQPVAPDLRVESMIDVTDELPLAPVPVTENESRVASGGSNRQTSSSGGDADGAGSGASGRRIAAAVLLVLAIGGAGVGAWWYLNRTPTHEVPDFVGRDIDEVRSAVVEQGWELDDRRFLRENGSEAGEILAQQPDVGTELAEGEAIEVTVSLGDDLVSLPVGLVGQARVDVETLLTESNLVPDVLEPRYSATVAEGSVIEVELPEGADAEKLEAGTRVGLVLSDGPEPTPVPGNLVGSPLDEARLALTAAGLAIGEEEEEVYDDEVPAGSVISTEPAEGVDAFDDTVVELVVSLGPELVPVPNVIGRTVDEAARILGDEGFAVSKVTGDRNLRVAGQFPTPGDEGSREDGVEIITR